MMVTLRSIFFMKGLLLAYAKPEITNYKHQITTSKSQIRSNANCLGFWISVIAICLVFVFCYLKFFYC
jgi:hypothetical protein